MAKPAVNIDSTNFGEITINRKTYYSDMTVFWDGKISFRSKEHVIELGEFLGVQKKGARVVVLGLGQNGVCRVAPEVEQWAGDKNIALYKETTPKAIGLFNAFVAQGRKVAGIFHVTC